MTRPRSQLVDPNVPLFYHLESRCVRRAWLCGFDRLTRRDYSHRKGWLIHRLEQLGAAFAVQVHAYAVMSNHFHLVVYYDPQAPARWGDVEVAERWLRVSPPKRRDGSVDGPRKALQRQALLAQPERLAELRDKLGSLSLFMKLLKQPISRRANLEDGCTGHFFEQRFYSAPILDEASLIAAMAYVDLNPIRAKIARSIEEAEHTSIRKRLNAAAGAHVPDSPLAPVIDGLTTGPSLSIDLRSYVERLEVLVPDSGLRWRQDKLAKWRDQVAMLGKKQRAFGALDELAAWIADRGWRLREIPLP